MNSQECIRTDVLIIGAGAAGARAAIEAAKHARVAMVCKHSVGYSGITPLAFTGYSAVTGRNPNDSPAIQRDDIIRAGYGLGDPDLIGAMVEVGNQTVDDLMSYGVRFATRANDLLLQIMPGNSQPRCLRIVGEGASFMRSLAHQVRQLSNVTLFPDTYVTNLLVRDGSAIGAAALDARTGHLRTFLAGAVILATGGCEQLWPHTDCPPESTGDGYAMALRVGTDLVDMEQQLFYPTVALWPDPIRGLEISYERCLRVGGGGQLVNGRGEVFFRAETFPTRDQLSNLIYQEINAGQATPHGGVYLDLRGAESWLKEELPRTLAPFSRLVHFGLDSRKDLIEVAPGAHTSLGGVRIDERARTNISGLFACGEVAGNIHGANRLAGHALLDTQAFGIIAGNEATAYAQAHQILEPSENQVGAERERVMSFLGRESGSIRPFELTNEIRQLMGKHVGSGRTEEGLRTALQSLRKLRGDRVANLKVEGPACYNNDWLEALEVVNMLDAAEAVVISALARQETRGTHVRTDRPHMDPNAQNVIIRSQRERISAWLEPVKKFREAK